MKQVILVCWFVLLFALCHAEGERNETSVSGHNTSTTEGSIRESEVDNNRTNIHPGGNVGHGNVSKDGGHKNANEDEGHGKEMGGGGHGEETEDGVHGEENGSESHGEETGGGGHGEEAESEHGSRLECNCECREVEEEEHHEGHKIIWPSVAGMMLFISMTGYLFYHFYTRYQMKNIMVSEQDHITFFKEAVVSSTVAGIAAPGMLGFHKSRKKSKRASSTQRE